MTYSIMQVGRSDESGTKDKTIIICQKYTDHFKTFPEDFLNHLVKAFESAMPSSFVRQRIQEKESVPSLCCASSCQRG